MKTVQKSRLSGKNSLNNVGANIFLGYIIFTMYFDIENLAP